MNKSAKFRYVIKNEKQQILAKTPCFILTDKDSTKIIQARTEMVKKAHEKYLETALSLQLVYDHLVSKTVEEY